MHVCVCVLGAPRSACIKLKKESPSLQGYGGGACKVAEFFPQADCYGLRVRREAPATSPFPWLEVR